MTEKERVDAALVRTGLFPSREKAQAAIMAAQLTLIAVPSQKLGQQAECSIPCTPNLLITEDHLPPEFHSTPVQTVPYISPDSFTAGDAFDY